MKEERQLVQLSTEHVAASLRIGYESLPDDMKPVYDRLRSAILSRAKELTVEDPDGRVLEHMSKIFIAVRQDDPYLFYLSKILKAENSDDEIIFMPRYLFGTFGEHRILKKIERAAEEMLEDLPDGVFERQAEIHGRVTGSITYPEDYDGGKKHEDYQTLVGALLNRKATCAGISNALNLLLNRAGIRCGTMRGTDHEGSGHTWNIVELGKKRYHLDATIDTRSEMVQFEAFNITDEFCRGLGYHWECGFKCDDPTMEFYTYTKGCIRAAEVIDFVAERISEGETDIAFRISDIENWNRSMHADVVRSSATKAAPATVFLKVNETRGYARLFVHKL